MQLEEKKLLLRLLVEEQAGALAVVVQGRPVSGLLPFTAAPDLLSFYIHASGLARHTAGLNQGAPFSLLIRLTAEKTPDAHQIPRVTLEGQTRRLNRGEPTHEIGRRIYLHKFPDSEGLFSLQDFNLYRLVVERARFVAGFGRAYNLSASSFTSLASEFLAPG